METTIGEMIDKLSVTNIKIFFLENIKRDQAQDDKTVADATRKTNTLNTYRNNLIQQIDKAFGQDSFNVKMYGK